MLLLLISFGLLGLSAANPVIPQKQKTEQLLDTSKYEYAIDITEAATSSQFKCLKQNKYAVAFIRGFTDSDGGIFDQNVVSNYKNARSAGLSAEIYMTPYRNGQTGASQVKELSDGLKKSGISVKRIWYQVSDQLHSYWSTDSDTNIAFMNSAINKLTQLGYKVGIYTSTHDWNLLTDNYTKLDSSIGLWYTDVNGQGAPGESTEDFSDFEPFGNWAAPDAKQFGEYEQICGLREANRDIVALYAF